MADFLPRGGPVSGLTLWVDTDDSDEPVVRFLVNGRDLFGVVAPEGIGFAPEEILGPDWPLLPVVGGRRVAVYRCSCGVAGCGSIAPVIVASEDGEYVHWVDFRNVVGVFDSPVANEVDVDPEWPGKAVDLPDLRFGMRQYVAEIERASQDRSWETLRR
ncbi:MAG: hypothetical protein QM708_02620 [Propioniciclava sp.]|uniref:hypothetical protein n=1 Tax=Propioniciclava sp. TaxID=2038686 RepID=UPI0039E2B6B0